MPQQKTPVFKSKHLYDSEYKVPMLNERVLQDHHPKKMAVLQKALERFEQNLEKKNMIEEHHVENHFKKIKKDFDDIEQVREQKKLIRDQFR